MVFCNNNGYSISITMNQGHNPYFSRWFSAILQLEINKTMQKSHNPYFSRWFSAILNFDKLDLSGDMSQSLF